VKECPFCREEIKDEAVKCRYCGSSVKETSELAPSPALPKAELESTQVLLVIDRGFLYFAKFVIGIVVVVIAFATAYFGFDLNKARESADQTRSEIQAALKDVQQQQTEMRKTRSDIEQSRKSMLDLTQKAQALLADAQQKSADTQAKLNELLARGQQESNQLHMLTIGIAAPPHTNDQIEGRKRPFAVTEIAALYDFPKELKGRGQTIGLIELGGGYTDADLDIYFSRLKLNRPKVVSVSVGQGANRPSGDASGPDGQVMLDIEVAGTIAPLANIVVYFASNTEAGFANAIRTASHDAANHPSVILISWGGPESTWSAQSRSNLDDILKDAASRGITVVVACGDSGVTDGLSDGRPHVGFPASSRWVLAVGGTTLMASGNAIASEVVWNDGESSGTGGGVSEVFAQPEWQTDAKVPRRKDQTSGRGVPDVAAVADPVTGYQARVDGKDVVLGGTAAAAPVWAGLVAILNQGVGRNLGYFNPLLYEQIGPQNVLRPITQGNNGTKAVAGFSAGPGWNAVAGWGSPDGRKLLDWLRQHLKAS
jgi:hypothetical protein